MEWTNAKAALEVPKSRYFLELPNGDQIEIKPSTFDDLARDERVTSQAFEQGAKVLLWFNGTR